MNRIFISIVLLNSFLGFIADGNAQSYVRLADATGIDLPSEDLTVLTNATDSIISLWPNVFEDNFKVFDCGFYLQQKGYVGGYFNYFTSFIQQAKAQSDFYLLFGRGINEQTGTLDFFIDISLPDTGKLSCLSTLDLETLIFKIENSLNQTSGNVFHDRELNGLIKLKDFLRSKMKCCFQGNRDENCTQCSVSDAEIEQFTKTIGLQEFTATIGETETDQTKEIILGNKYYFNNVNKKIVINDSIFLTEAFLKGVTFDSSSNYKMSTIVFNKNTFCTEDLIKISNKIKESNDVLLMIEYDESNSKFSKYLYVSNINKVNVIALQPAHYFNIDGNYLGHTLELSNSIKIALDYWCNSNTYFIIYSVNPSDYKIDISNVKAIVGILDYFSTSILDYHTLTGGNFSIVTFNDPWGGDFIYNTENVKIHSLSLAHCEFDLHKLVFYCHNFYPQLYFDNSRDVYSTVFHENRHFKDKRINIPLEHLAVFEFQINDPSFQLTSTNYHCKTKSGLEVALDLIKNNFPLEYNKYKKLLDKCKNAECPD